MSAFVRSLNDRELEELGSWIATHGGFDTPGGRILGGELGRRAEIRINRGERVETPMNASWYDSRHVDEDDVHAAEWAIECKRRGYGYGPGSSTKAEDAAYLRELRRQAAEA